MKRAGLVVLLMLPLGVEATMDSGLKFIEIVAGAGDSPKPGRW